MIMLIMITRRRRGSYQASLGTADDDDAFYEARAAAVYAACKEGGVKGSLQSNEAQRLVKNVNPSGCMFWG